MNFDLTWFTEIPGILVTIGIVLLIVALIFNNIPANRKYPRKGLKVFNKKII